MKNEHDSTSHAQGMPANDMHERLCAYVLGEGTSEERIEIEPRTGVRQSNRLKSAQIADRTFRTNGGRMQRADRGEAFSRASDGDDGDLARSGLSRRWITQGCEDSLRRLGVASRTDAERTVVADRRRDRRGRARVRDRALDA